MNFSKNLFWDADPQQLDLDRNRPYVIERVLNRGTLEDMRAIFGYYGWDEVLAVATHLRSLEPKALAFFSCITSTPRERFRCYTSKQFSQAPWIY